MEQSWQCSHADDMVHPEEVPLLELNLLGLRATASEVEVEAALDWDSVPSGVSIAEDVLHS